MLKARLLLFKLSPGSAAFFQGVVSKIDTPLKARKGFRGVTYFTDDATGECGGFVLWDSEENAEAARIEIFPKFEAALKGMMKETPRHPLFAVFEPEV